MIDITANTIFELVPQSEFKDKISKMVLKLNKAMGNAHTQEEVVFVSSEIWKPIYFKNPKLPLGLLYRYYDEVLNGTIQLKKLTVQAVLSSINEYAAKFRESERAASEKFQMQKEKDLKYTNALAINHPIARAACWMITMRCDGYNLDNITVRQVADCIEKGQSPYLLIKEDKKNEETAIAIPTMGRKC